MIQEFMLNYLFYLIILVLGVLAGVILEKLCKDEVQAWKKRLTILSIFSLAGSFIVFFINFEYKLPIIITFMFIIVTSTTIIWKIR
ncbi:Uncharacterised protein [uncultured archaeon]|nr:Uncharacterised protein [uncultured archaeon]